MSIKAALLSDRSVIEAAGEERASFLQGLITNDVERLEKCAACFAGLLSPQGKILFDFFVINTGGAFLLDCPAAAAGDLLKRLTFYKLRAKVSLSDVSAQWRVAAAWGEGAAGVLKANAAFSYRDPRLASLGCRGLASAPPSSDFALSVSDYDAMRIAAAIPEGSKDYAFGDAFPHEACFDVLNGVNFNKGCYVGQEVVSRMQHRGTARTRILTVSAQEPLPRGGADILADGFAVGRLGSVAGHRGVALARLDRVKEALAKGKALIAGGVPVALSVPSWAGYSLASDAAEAVH
jgi:folate-binding protein YgfZ